LVRIYFSSNFVLDTGMRLSSSAKVQWIREVTGNLMERSISSERCRIVDGAGVDIRKPTMAVLYGQPDRMSTSFQTTQLASALEPWLTTLPLRVAPNVEGKWQRQAAVLWRTNLRFRLAQPASDYVLYGNDGMADLRAWRCKRLLYWYDAPWDWAALRPTRRQWVHWIRLQNLICADHVFAVSQTQVELARRLRPNGESSVHYLPVGVDCAKFDPAKADGTAIRAHFGLPNKTIIGYLGYLGIRYGRFAGQLLAEVAPTLLSEFEAHFLVVGAGPGLERFRRLVNDLGMAQNFTFTGFVPDEILTGCLAAMNICVDTLEEGFHSLARSETKLKQYMAMGKICVATGLGENLTDLDDGRCGILVEPGRQGLMQGLRYACSHLDELQHLGLAARERAVQFYDWRRIAQRLADAIFSQ
jgi:glycosyltransferase involved in cell wall biosynthesis